MNLVSYLELPAFDDAAPDLLADHCHQRLAGSFGVTSGPLAQHIDTSILNLTGLGIIWPGSPPVNPDHGPEPYVS
ncbi:MAG: hypothetical protein M3Z75_21610 [Actinomycetota bacterium]|nr:hypothetical protein [Actinomycetota bacterium]